MSVLTGKPLWFYWIFFIVLCGVIFGISYGLIFVLALRWWIAVLAILAAGGIWGTIAYKQSAPSATAEPDIQEE